MIVVDGLRKAYGDTVVLAVDEWTMESGHCVLVGDNGAGKTTLLLILAGLEAPSHGSAKIDGHPAGSRAARAILSFAPDQPALFDDLTVSDQMTYVARLHGLDAPHESARELASALDAERLLDRFPRGMSKGQRQKAGLLVASARPFDVLLLDEPTTGLDAPSRAGLLAALQQLASQGRTILSSTHDADLIDAADRVVRVADGKLRTERSSRTKHEN